jgi:hypothetical protein
MPEGALGIKKISASFYKNLSNTFANNEIHWKCSECVNSGTITGLLKT